MPQSQSNLTKSDSDDESDSYEDGNNAERENDL